MSIDSNLFLVIGTIFIALIFAIINGFHDAANSIATIVSTRVLPPRLSVLLAAFFNFIAMFIFVPRVAETVSKIIKINYHDPALLYVILAGLIGAIMWDLLTWWWGFPTSSSHALIGGLIGAGIAYKGLYIICWDKITTIIKFIPLAPIIGLAFGYLIMVSVYWIFRHREPSHVDHIFRKGQILSAALYSLGHGGNDAQKTIGVIMALLVAAGRMNPQTQLSLGNLNTLWIIVACYAAMSLGTALGGWRIVKTMGMKLTKLKPVDGFCAETAGAITLFFINYFGIPVSTTHTIAGSIVGVGATKKILSVKWGLSLRILWTWVLTIPFSALIAAVCFYVIKYFRPGF